MLACFLTVLMAAVTAPMRLWGLGVGVSGAWTLGRSARLAACKTLASRSAACSCLTIVRFASGPKRSMGHVMGVEKGIFLIRGRRWRHGHGGRACGILSIRGPEVSPGLPRVDTIHVQSPTPHTPPLPAYFGQFSQPNNPFAHELLGNGFQSSWAPQESAHAA